MSTPAAILAILLPAVTVALWISLPGLAWAWMLGPFRARTDTFAAVLITGGAFSLLAAVLLAEAGLFTTTALLAAQAWLILTGVLAGRHRAGTAEAVRRGWPFLPLCAIATALLLATPNRGEWIIGGWDPGVNINQGLLLSRTGTLHPGPDAALAAIPVEDRALFARPHSGRAEVFPGMPADLASASLRPYFYRATPTLVALLDRAGGRDAALRVNLIAGAGALFLLYALLRGRSGRIAALAALAVAALQPMFLHHTQSPASEMLELALLCALGFVLSRPASTRSDLVAAILVVAAIINRVSFLFLAPVLVVALAAESASEPDRRAALRRPLAIAAALALGLAWYAFITPGSWIKVAHLGGRLSTLFVLCACALVAFLAYRSRRVPKPGDGSRLTLVLTLALVTLLAAREFTRHEPWSEFGRNVDAWIDYAGAAPLLAAACGLVLLAVGLRWDAWLAALAFGLVVTLLQKHAADLYPWALKRWLPFTIPLLAVGVAAMLDAARRRFGPRGLAAAALVLAVATFPLAPRIRAAWTTTEYNGVSARLAEVSVAIGNTDLVVADHFRWAMPLSLGWGLPVLNGEPVASSPDLTAADDAARALAAARSDGRRILLLTSTGDGLDAFPPPLSRGMLLREWPPVEYRELIHHRSARDFETRLRSTAFRLYEWRETP